MLFQLFFKTFYNVTLGNLLLCLVMCFIIIKKECSTVYFFSHACLNYYEFDNFLFHPKIKFSVHWTES